MKTFVSESLSSAILDSGATATVIGRIWIECYIETLSNEEKDKMYYGDSAKSFKFGSGKVFPALYRTRVPAKIGSRALTIEVDVVDTDIPLLLSRKAMKKAETNINFKNDTVTMFGEELPVIVTKSGHYALPLDDKIQIMKDVTAGKSKITLHLKTVESSDKKKIATIYDINTTNHGTNNVNYTVDGFLI